MIEHKDPRCQVDHCVCGARPWTEKWPISPMKGHEAEEMR